MSENKKKRVGIELGSIHKMDFDGPMHEFISWIKDNAAKLGAGDKFISCLANHDYDGGSSLDFEVYRYETDEEAGVRIAHEQARAIASREAYAQRQREGELAALAALKAKYEGCDT